MSTVAVTQLILQRVDTLEPQRLTLAISIWT
jgi:hypothetical protein